MGQTGSTDHQRQSEQNHVQRIGVVAGVAVKAQFGHKTIQFLQERLTGGSVLTQHAQSGDGVTCQLQRDKDRGDRIGSDQHNVLSNLCVRHTLHTAKHGVGEHNTGTDQQTGGCRHFEEATERNTHTLHLADHVCDGSHKQTDHSNHACSLGVETVPDELGHGELAEFAQVRRKQQSQKHIAASPTHEEGRVVVAGERDQTRH